MNQFKPTQYSLVCLKTGKKFSDEGWTLDNKESDTPTLIRPEYAKKQLEVKENSWGVYKFADWLPINRTLSGSCAPVTYKSEGLSKCLGLDNLYITISGYFPEKGANFTTCSFKETEAYAVCGRMTENSDKVLVVASAGNTARAFAKVCSENKIKLLLCVPQDNIDALWFESPIDEEYVKLITTESGSDYFDAIALSNTALKCEKYYPEGGAKNIARRDGMATTYNSATTFIGEIPDYYFQAVGSGTGAIAAWEANLRFIEDGRYGNKKTRLMLSQNDPFLPMYDAWKAKSRALLSFADQDARGWAESVDAKVLTNRQPPYSINGGMYDALCDTNGEMYKVTNEQLRQSIKLFEEVEGIDIYSASAVAVTSLIEAVKNGDVDPKKIVMLNITGAGEKRLKGEKELFYLKPVKIFPINSNSDEVIKFVEKLFCC